MDRNANKIKYYAVYGSLRKGLMNHCLIEDEEFIGEAYTQPIFNLFPLASGSYPGVTYGGDTSIKIEIYEINDEITENRVDQLEGYISKNNSNNFYNKDIITTPYGLAYIYIYNDKNTIFEYESIPHGDWVEYKKEKAKDALIAKMINSENE